MKIKFISVLVLSCCLMACQQNSQTKAIETTTANEMPKTTDTHNQPIANNKIDIFYLTDDNINFNEAISQPRLGADLILHNHCLSIKVDDVNGENIGMLAIPHNAKVIFDDKQNIIGLLNTKTKKQILFGERIGLSALGAVDIELSNKKVPKHCPKIIYITHEIL